MRDKRTPKDVCGEATGNADLQVYTVIRFRVVLAF